jgi:hypothetical protein
MAQKIEQYKHTHKKNELSEIEINQTILKWLLYNLDYSRYIFKDWTPSEDILSEEPLNVLQIIVFLLYLIKSSKAKYYSREI